MEVQSNGKKYEKSPIAGGNGSWEHDANSYFSRGRGDAVNENVEVLVGENEIEKKSTIEEDGANDSRFLQGWSKTAVKGNDWMSQEEEDNDDSYEESEGEEGKRKLTGNSRRTGIRDRYSRILDTRDEFDKLDVV
ncbi:hypothetical protein EJ110_NYTH30662 [Nymphaea thermarum]|nr:hypothetical protein EJ110_NYTH30662 [Nymphaea thermarum]